MTAGRPAPRWGAALISYMIASLAAGIVLGAIDNLSNLLAGDLGLTALANAAVSCLVYAAVIGLNGILPVALVGLGFWWFRTDNIAAYIGAAVLIAGALVAAGLSFGDIELVPAAAVGGAVYWLCMRFAPAPIETV